jgi:hypothetical protein
LLLASRSGTVGLRSRSSYKAGPPYNPAGRGRRLADRLSDCRREALDLIYETIAGTNPPV